MTFNKKHCLIFLAIIVILTIGLTQASATDININNTQEKIGTKELSTPNNYDVDKMVQSETIISDADVEKTDTTNQEIKQISKNTKTYNKESSENINSYDGLKDLLTNSNEEELTVNLIEGDFNSTGEISVSSAIKNLTINGNSITIDGNENGEKFLEIGSINLTLNNIIVKNFHAAYDDGAVIHANKDNTNITLIDSEFEKNYAEGDRGGVTFQNDYSNLIVINCTFNENQAEDAGGVIYQGEYSNISINNSRFNGNVATTQGGAIYVRSKTSIKSLLTIFNSTFIANTCEDRGGAILYLSPNLFINDSVFKNNEVTNEGEGGAICAINLELNRCNFTENHGDIGGAISIQFNLTVSDCNFTDNTADSYGGAICDWSSRFEDEFPDTLIGYTNITNTRFTNNSAAYGGAVLVNPTCDDNDDVIVGNYITIKDSEFVENKASTTGGAFYILNAINATIDGTSFTNNTAEKAGAIFVGTELNISITYSNFTENNATNGIGGAICSEKNINITTNYCNFTSNNATSDGGAIYNGISKGIYNNTNFFNNSAIYSGAAIYVNNTGNITIADSNFTDNLAYQGSAVYAENSNVNISGSEFEHNIAGKNNHGGAAYLMECISTVSGSNFTRNIANSGSGLYAYESQLNVTECNFDSNSVYDTPNSGIAILSWSSKLYVNNSNFTNNKFSGSNSFEGGAIAFLRNKEALIENSLLENNSAYQGGAISCRDGVRLTIRNSSILNNEASYDGGAIWSQVTNSSFHNYIDVINSTISNSNAKARYGGGLYLLGTNTVNIINSTLEKNKASVASVIFAYKYGSLTPAVNVVNSTIKENTGILIYNQVSLLSINSSNITNNTCNRLLYNNGGATTNFNINNITDNKCPNQQMLFNTASTLNLIENNIINNTASDIIYNTGTTTITSNTIEENYPTRSFLLNNGDLTFSYNEMMSNYVTEDTYLLHNNGGTLNVKHNTFINNTDNSRDMLLNNNSGNYNVENNNVYIDNFLEDNINPIDPITVTGEGEENLEVTIDLRSVYNNKIVNGTVILYDENDAEISRADVEDGTATISITKNKLAVGLNALNLTYNSLSKHYQNNSIKLEITRKVDSEIKIEELPVTEINKSVEIIGFVYDDYQQLITTGFVNLTINNTTYETTFVDGKFNLTYTSEQPGEFPVVAKYYVDETAGEASIISDEVNLTVTKIHTTTALVDVLNNTVNNVTLKINVTNSSGGLNSGSGIVRVINATNGELLGEKTLEEGIVIITLNGVEYPGSIDVNITYSGDDYFFDSKAIGNLSGDYENTTRIVIRMNPKITLEVNNTHPLINETFLINGTVIGEDGLPVNSGKVNITIDDENITVSVKDDGTYLLDTYTHDIGEVIRINATYIKDDEIIALSDNTDVTVEKIPSITVVNILNNKYGNVTIEVTVVNDKGRRITVGNISVRFDDGSLITEESVGNGIVKVLIPTSSLDDLLVNASYIGNDYYLPSNAQGNPEAEAKENTTRITVEGLTPTITLTIENPVVNIGDNIRINGTATDNIGEALPDGTVITINIGGVEKTTSISGSEGKFELSYLTTSAGTFTANATKDDITSNNVEFTVNKILTNTNVQIMNNTAGNVKINITVKGEDGAVIKEGKVNITIAGNTPIEVDLSGNDYTVVDLADNITSSGNISVKVLYTGNDTYLESVANNTADNKELRNITVVKQLPIVKVSVDSENVVNSTSIVISVTLTDEDENTIADRYVDIFVADKLVASVKTDSMGKFTYSYVADSLGEVSVNATFNGDVGENGRYSNATDTTKFTVYKLNTTVDLNVSDITCTDTEVINFTVNDTSATGKITLKITGDTLNFISIQEYEFEGEALSYDLSNLEAGEYTVTVSYDGDPKFNGNDTSKTFKVEKVVDYTLNVTATNITYGEDEFIIIFLPSDAKGRLNYTIKGENVYLTIRGVLDLEKTNVLKTPAYVLYAGNYEVNISYADDNYALKTNNTKFVVSKAASSVVVSAVNITRGYNETITVELAEYEYARGNISVEIQKGKEVVTSYVISRADLVKGKNITLIANLEDGSYTVSVKFTDKNYEDSYANTTFTVSLPVVRLYDNQTLYVGELARIHGTVRDVNEAKLEGSIVIRINGSEEELSLDKFEEGKTYNLQAGKYPANATYVLFGEEIASSNNIVITVNKIPTITSINVVNSTMGNVVVDLMVKENVPGTSGIVSTGSVNLTVGKTTIPVKLTGQTTRVDLSQYITEAGNIRVSAVFTEDNTYLSSNTTTTINVAKIATVLTVSATSPVKAGKSSTITGKLTDKNNKAIVNAKVVVKVDNKIVGNVTTDKNGIYTFNYETSIVGTHNVSCNYEANNSYKSSNATTSFEALKLDTKITLDKQNDVIIGNNVQITGKLTDEYNNPLNKATIKVSFDGTSKTVTTDKTGKFVSIFSTESIGQKEIIAIYAGNKTYNAIDTDSKIKVIKDNATLTVKVPGNAKALRPANITGTLKDKNNKIVANTLVNVTVNGKRYTTTTDSNGNYEVEVYNVVEGDNNVTVKSASDKYNINTISTKFNAKLPSTNITVNKVADSKMDDKITIKGKLVDEDNKAIANANVVVKVNDKTYNVTTDKSGNYKVSNPELKVGTDNVAVKYESNMYKASTAKTTFKVTKLKTTLKVQPITGVIGEDITLTATILDEKGNKVTGGNLVFKLNGKTLRSDGRFDSNATPLKLKVKNGKVTYTIKADIYMRNGKNITASYSGTNIYDEAKGNVASVNIAKRYAQVSVNVTPGVAKQNSTIVFTATLKDVTKNAKNTTCITTNGDVIFKINGKTIKDAKGKVLRINATSTVINYAYYVPTGMGGVTANGTRNYSVEAVYNNSIYYPDARGSSAFNVERSIVNINFIKTTVKGNVLSIKANFTDYENKYLVGENKVCIKINGKTYQENGKSKYFTVKNGRVNLSGIKLASGTKVKSIMLVTGAREAYLGARVTTTDITTS